DGLGVARGGWGGDAGARHRGRWRDGGGEGDAQAEQGLGGVGFVFAVGQVGVGLEDVDVGGLGVGGGAVVGVDAPAADGQGVAGGLGCLQVENLTQVGALRVESGQASGDVALRVHVDDAGGDSPAGQGAGGFAGGDGLAAATFVGEERVSRGAVGHGGVLSVGWLGDLGVEPAQECAVVGGVPVG